MTHDKSSRPPGKQTDVDLPEEVVPPGGGGARPLSFGWGGLPGSHGSRSMGADLQK